MVGVLRAVGRVQVDDHVRVVVAIGADQRPRLRRLQLHVVAVQVEPLRVAPRAHAADRAELVRPIVEGHPLVAVGVVDGGDEQDQRRQPLLVRAGHEVAQQHQQRFLAANLAAVDVRLQPDTNPIGSHHRCGPGVGNIPDYDERERSALHRRPEAGDMDPGGQIRAAFKELDDLVVPGRLPVASPLRAGQQSRIVRLRQRAFCQDHRKQAGHRQSGRGRCAARVQCALHVR